MAKNEMYHEDFGKNDGMWEAMQARSFEEEEEGNLSRREWLYIEMNESKYKDEVENGLC